MFTQQEFYQMFADYNTAIGFIPGLAYGLGLLILAGLLLPQLKLQRAVWFLLGALWLWTGGSYLYMVLGGHVAPLRIFGLLFLIQGGALCGFAVLEQFQPRAVSAGQKTLGMLLALTALVFYPLIGMAAGHAYPAAPSFGVTPCPLVIFTFGALLLSPYRHNLWFFVIPTVWALFGGTATILLGVRQDALLPLSAIVAIAASGYLGQKVQTLHGDTPQPSLSRQS